jgi:hypothetical protein
VLALGAAVYACKAATVSLDNLACDAGGGCVAGYVCQVATNTCVPVTMNQDGNVVEQDGNRDDGGDSGGNDSGPPTIVPHQSVTAGGARRTSPNYTLDVFVAPVAPSGAASSTNYKVRLGPEPTR